MKGSEIVAQFPESAGPQREAAVLAVARAGHLHVWPFVPVALGPCTIFAATDYASVGEAADFARVPMSPLTAQRIADLHGWSLPTPKMVDAIWKAAAVKLQPSPMGPPKYALDATMMSTSRFVKHHELIEAARAGAAGLVAGHKKDVVLSDALALLPDRVAIYGWHYANGTVIQTLSTRHENSYADYSHGVRFILGEVEVNGARMPLAQALTDATLSRHLAGAPDRYPAPMEVTRIPGVAAQTTPIVPSTPATTPAVPTSAAAVPASLGLAMLAEAEADYALDIKEVGVNDGPEIRALYLTPMHLVPGQNWCAAAITMWMRRACDATQIASPIAGSIAAKAFIAQIQDAQRLGRATWIPRSKLKAGDVRPGAIAVWDRSTPGKPATSWMGHIGLVQAADGAQHMFTLEGNGPGDCLARVRRRLDDPRFLGLGHLDTTA